MDMLFKIESLEEFSAVCDDIFTNLLDKDHNLQFDNNFLNSVRKQIYEIILSTHGNSDDIVQILLNEGYESTKVNHFASSIENRKGEFLYLTLLKETSKQGEVVATFDWRLKLICGTSELKTLNYPLLQLIFTTFLNTDGEKERLYDIDKKMLVKLIDILKNIDQTPS